MVSDDVQILHSKKTAKINVKKTFQFITMCKGDFWGSCPTVPENMCVKFEVRSFNRFGAIGI